MRIRPENNSIRWDVRTRQALTTALNTLARWRPRIIKPREMREIKPREMREIDEGARCMKHLAWWHRPSRRRQAIKTLAALQDVRAITPLIRCLRSRYRRLRDAAITALVDIGPPAVECLLGTLLDGSSLWRTARRPPRLHQHIKTALFRMDLAAISPCIRALSHLSLHHHAKDILVSFPGERLEPVLADALEHDDEMIRRTVAEILEQRGWAPDTDHRRTAFHVARGTIERVIFTQQGCEGGESVRTLRNPETQRLHIPVRALTRICIHPETADVYLIERFLTYAVNTLGQAYLKRAVTVRLYGDARHFPKHLTNLLTNLCKGVFMHRETMIPGD